MVSDIMLLVTLAFLVVAVTSVAFAQEAAPTQKDRVAVELPRVMEKPPALDGSLTGWEDAVKVSLAGLKDGSRAEVRTEVRLGYDRENIYVHFICHEPAVSKLQAHAAGRDDDFGQDDTVQVFFAPEPVESWEVIPVSTSRGWKLSLIHI